MINDIDASKWAYFYYISRKFKIEELDNIVLAICINPKNAYLAFCDYNKDVDEKYKIQFLNCIFNDGGHIHDIIKHCSLNQLSKHEMKYILNYIVLDNPDEFFNLFYNRLKSYFGDGLDKKLRSLRLANNVKDKIYSIVIMEKLIKSNR